MNMLNSVYECIVYVIDRCSSNIHLKIMHFFGFAVQLAQAANVEVCHGCWHSRANPFRMKALLAVDYNVTTYFEDEHHPSAGQAPMIEVKHLVKRYGNVAALKGISFTAQRGEIVGLLGPNGAGKTTTMRILTGFMPPTEGTVKICGFDVVEDSMEVRKRVGYMPERVPIYPDMTVEGYVSFWAKLRGVRNVRQSVHAVLEQFQLQDRRRQLVRFLSKGLRQRLGLAQTLVHQPEVVILDEPTIGIDPRQVIEVRESVRRLKEGRAVLFSSHILSEVEQVCDRVIIIHQGQIVGEGTPQTLSRQLAHRQQIFIVVEGGSDAKIKGMLKKLPKVVDVRAMDDGFLVAVQSEDDLRPALSRLITAEGMTIVEMRTVESRLEDVFLTLTEGKSS